jgi:hypothetical protein
MTAPKMFLEGWNARMQGFLNGDRAIFHRHATHVGLENRTGGWRLKETPKSNPPRQHAATGEGWYHLSRHN